MTFPDYGPQEEMIVTIGKAELLYKQGVKILRWEKSTYGRETEVAIYNQVKVYFTGRVLNVGLGMGNSVDIIIAQAAVTEVIVYELEQDIADVYAHTHDPLSPKLTITVADAHQNKPTGTFDVVLYELETSSQALWDEAKDYLDWVFQNLNEGGAVILPHKSTTLSLANQYTSQANIIILSQHTGRKPEPLWIVMEKT